VIPPGQKLIFPWCSKLPRFVASLPVRHLAKLLYLQLVTQSHTKSFRYVGGCLVRCPRSKKSGVLAGEDGVLTGGRLCSTGGVTGLLVTGVSALISSDGAPHREGGFALPDPSQVPEVVALGLALWAVGALPLTEVAFPPSPSPLSTTRPPHILARGAAAHALLSASWAPTTWRGASPVASGLVQYGFKRASFLIDTCPEHSSLYVWLGITSTTA